MTPEEKIARLETKKQQLQARIANEKAKLGQQERKNDTRRKILLGAFLQTRMTDPQVRARLANQLGEFLQTAKVSQRTKHANIELFRPIMGDQWTDTLLRSTRQR